MMWIVHAGWEGSEGPEYKVAGVFTEKDWAMKEARELAESLACGDDYTVKENLAGVEMTHNDIFLGEQTIQVYVEEITPDASSEIGQQI